MKEKIVRLNCDVCSKQTEFVDNKDGYPYNDGWCYLYNFNGKIATKKTHRLHTDFTAINFADKHFCSVKCLSDFINNHVTLAHKNVVKDETFKKLEGDLT